MSGFQCCFRASSVFWSCYLSYPFCSIVLNWRKGCSRNGSGWNMSGMWSTARSSSRSSFRLNWVRIVHRTNCRSSISFIDVLGRDARSSYLLYCLSASALLPFRHLWPPFLTWFCRQIDERTPVEVDGIVDQMALIQPHLGHHLLLHQQDAQEALQRGGDDPGRRHPVRHPV